MSTALVLTSSALAGASVSSQLVKYAVALLHSRDPALRVITRDLGRSPIPHLTSDAATALRSDDLVNEAQVAAQALSNELIAELKAADTVIIGAPMYNFGIPSTLKAWFDHVLRAGITFRYTENGPEGLVTGKQAIVIESRGGFYSEGPAQILDSQEPHLRNLLSFMGITYVTFVRAEKLAFGSEAREHSIGAAHTQIEQAILGHFRQAA
jgi:FMN-dependent NADH-azoreductase